MSEKKQVKQQVQLPVLNAFDDSTGAVTQEKTTSQSPIKEFEDDDAMRLKRMVKITEDKIKTQQKEPDIYVFKLLLPSDVKPKVYESLVNEMPVFDPQSNSVRTIRLIRGASSIWMDEQEGFTPQYIQRNKQDIVFNNGILRVPRTNRTLLNFLLNSDDYDKKENRMRNKKARYTLVNTAENESNELKKEEGRLRAINFAMNASVEDMMIHAQYLGIGMTNEYGEQKTIAKVRVEYANKAGANPDAFMKSAGTTISKVQFFVKKGIDDGHIDVSTKKGYACWKDGAVICEIPLGKKAYESITEFAMTKTKEANEFYETLKNVVSE
jgi:hypothetical protein